MRYFISDSDMEAKNGEIASLDKDFQAKINEVLTPEQYETYKKEMKEVSGK